MDDKIIYSLGNTCWVWGDIPPQYRVHDCLFKGAGGITSEYFTPKFLFDMEMRNEFFKFENWSVKIQKPDWIKGFCFDLIYYNNKCNLQFHHVNARKDEISHINTVNDVYFNTFDENKYNYFYIIDFQRYNYRYYTNTQILDFEQCILNQGFNPQNFIYLEVSDAEIQDRFNGCQIPVLINDIDNKNGYGYPDAPNTFRNTYCFFNENMDYVKEQVERIKK